MKVRAKMPFSGLGFSYRTDQVFDLPKDVDWLKEGLVEKLETKKAPAKKAAPKKTAK